MFFKDIVGQNEVKSRLIQMVESGRMPHAVMFAGAAGVGKLSLALASARYIFCRQRVDGDACGTCRSCVQFNKYAHPDLNFVFPMLKSKERGVTLCDDVVDSFREALIDSTYLSINDWMSVISEGKVGTIYAEEGNEIIKKTAFKPYQSEYKIFIIWLPEKMTDECANKILKVIEEPPTDTIFFLVSDSPDNVISTIQSRCQRVTVPLIDKESMKVALQTQYQMDSAEEEFIVRSAMGSWHKLLDLLDQSEDTKLNFELFVEMMRLAWNLNIKGIRAWLDKMNALGREKQVGFMQNAQRLVRENFILRLNSPELNYLSREEKAFADKFAQFIHECNIVEIMEELALAEAQIAQNGNAKIILFHLEIVLYKLLKKPRA